MDEKKPIDAGNISDSRFIIVKNFMKPIVVRKEENLIVCCFTGVRPRFLLL